ncbi:hypothetical protein [uncultured Brevundimonas sp.]|uniref:hypothetical protein n=1 Tax=uncultured Brevundimonas sp. TaxID=213418 RepID=UPI0030EE85FB|tara:strand:+ start:97 stop:516 length:420 start_codon:yes stop_codon:yes gene_type:complete
MSADEFDPFVERLFNQAPVMPDAVLFAARVETRLRSGSRLRNLALTLAGLVGGVVAVRETMSANLDLTRSGAVVTERSLGQGLETAVATTGGLIQSTMEPLGLTRLDLGSFGGMQMFWIAAAAVIALAAAGAMKLSEEI